MDDFDFVHRLNLENFRKQLAEAKDATRRVLLAKLIAEEEAKDAKQPG